MKNRNNKLVAIEEFSRPYYAGKDIMHDWTHIERVGLAVKRLLALEGAEVDRFVLQAALAFHGFIYTNEDEIRSFLQAIEISPYQIDSIIQVAWESQKEGRPSTPEGCILHDAHLLEGGQYFEIIKSFITGSVRGQSLQETLQYIEHHLLDKGQCYTSSGQQLYLSTRATTQNIYRDLIKELELPTKN